MNEEISLEKTNTSAIKPADTVFDHLSRQHDLQSAAARFASRTGLLQQYAIHCDLPALAAACRAVIARYGLRGFRNTDDDSDTPAYGSLSLTCNPDRDGDPHSSTLGSAHLRQGQYFYATPQSREQMPAQKGDYYDTYGFRRLTPAGNSGALGELLRGFRLPVVRSRLSVIQANRIEASQFSFGWHRDETVFHNLRINIPIWTRRTIFWKSRPSTTDPIPLRPRSGSIISPAARPIPGIPTNRTAFSRGTSARNRDAIW